MKITTLLLLLCTVFAVKTIAQTPLTKSGTVHICFKDAQYPTTTEFQSFLQENNFVLEKGIKLSEEQFEYLKQQVQKNTGSSASVEKLNRIYSIALPYQNKEALNQLYSDLSLFNGVAYFVKPLNTAPLPPADIPPATPSYFLSQGYIQADPGVNMQYAWDLGYAGAGINLKDVEYGVNTNHEEFNETNTAIAAGMTISNEVPLVFTEHGTAAIGVAYANNGTYGVSGMAYELNEAILYPEWTQEGGYNRVTAVTQAINTAVAGDVIMYELQVSVLTNSDFVPAEYDQVIWDLTRAATDAGIVIVAAAGNGSQNLDSFDFIEYMNRGDSGAIIVGAGTPNTNHDRIGFSTYGSRVDVQGWGQNVVTTGYGDLYAIGNDFNQYYTSFSGTSSATPIIASCAAVLQSYFNQQSGGGYLTSQQIRTVLKETGIAQGTATVVENIGPIPNMEAAIDYINNNLLYNQGYVINQNELRLFPNPSTETITVALENSTGNFEITIFNALGQIVHQDATFSGRKEINITDVDRGIYFLELKNGNQSYLKKFIKK
ncbi:S8 family peptidase [Flavobacterium litorale]|uniref:S8 family peptidase n=1 Tax=Flavobacterium litorale TaxID=2856519 RepID=A0ABX8VBR3_9FLAO|nr:S8 family peptidase [Flavobacterium litorale]QYJ68466.1 S8 family peptidase [Flavobacterium litorale]